MSEIESVPGYPQLVRLSDYNEAVNRLIQKRANRLIEKQFPQPSLTPLPPNWPPPGWRGDIAPVDGSVAAIVQWLDFSIKPLGDLESRQRTPQSLADRFLKGLDATDLVDDAYLLVEVLEQTHRWRNAPKKPPDNVFSFRRARDILRDIRDWIEAVSEQTGDTTTIDAKLPVTSPREPVDESTTDMKQKRQARDKQIKALCKAHKLKGKWAELSKSANTDPIIKELGLLEITRHVARNAVIPVNRRRKKRQ